MKVSCLYSSCRRRCAVLACLALACASAYAQDYSGMLKALTDAVHKEAGAQQPEWEKAHPNARVPSADEANPLLWQLQTALSAGGQNGLAASALEQLRYWYPSPEVAAACAQIKAQVQREEDAQTQAMLARWQTALARATQAVKAAKVPADLDASLQELTDMSQETVFPGNNATRSTFNDLSSARSSVIAWQDYLSARNSGDTHLAIETLRNASNSMVQQIVPRSELLARMEELKTGRNAAFEEQAAAIVSGTKSLESIAASEQKLAALITRAGLGFDSSSPQGSIGKLLYQLQSVGGYYNDYRAGLPVSVARLIDRSAGGNEPADPAVIALRGQLVRLVLARELGADGKLAPGPEEPVGDYLQRLLADAMDGCDARQITKVRDLQMATGLRPLMPGNPEGLHALAAAQSQEEAGQYIPAVVSYEEALRAGDEYVSAKAIGNRLNTIKAAHPDDFDRGLQTFLSRGSPPTGSDHR